MLTEDYIMRMINQALAVFLQALGLKKARKYEEAQQAFDQAVEGLLGLRAGLVDQLDDQSLLAMLTFRGRMDIERLLLLADIYRERGEVFALQGDAPSSKLSNLRSLRLYLEAALTAGEGLSLDIVQKVEARRAGILAADMPMETRLRLMDYFEYMLSMGEDFLEASGVTREEIRAWDSMLKS